MHLINVTWGVEKWHLLFAVEAGTRSFRVPALARLHRHDLSLKLGLDHPPPKALCFETDLCCLHRKSRSVLPSAFLSSNDVSVLLLNQPNGERENEKWEQSKELEMKSLSGQGFELGFVPIFNFPVPRCLSPFPIPTESTGETTWPLNSAKLGNYKMPVKLRETWK